MGLFLFCLLLAGALSAWMTLSVSVAVIFGRIITLRETNGRSATKKEK